MLRPTSPKVFEVSFSHRFARVTHLPAIAIAAAVAVAGLVACGGATPTSKLPARAEGCDVQSFRDAPRTQTENIGTVSAVCDESISDDDCLRQLKDEVCKVGGDVVWGVPDKPTLAGGKKRLSARAAHTAAKPAK